MTTNIATEMARRARAETRGAWASDWSLYLWAGAFSFVGNFFALAGPLFMLQVYDRVLPSRDIDTLVILFILTFGLFAAMGALDHFRGRILARAGARFQTRLEKRAFEAELTRAVDAGERARPATALRDLESIQQFLSGPAPAAFFDAPWAPVYLAGIFMFHWTMGVLALAGAVVLFFLALLTEWTTKAPEEAARRAGAQAEQTAISLRRDAETARALGMVGAALSRWTQRRAEALKAQMRQSDRAGVFQAAGKAIRMLLQSAMLGLAAYWVVQGEVSSGAMIASSILMGRALSPVEQAIGQWRSFQKARAGFRSLGELFAAVPADVKRTALPAPAGRVEARSLMVAPPGARVATLRGVSFQIKPGEAMGVIGPSGSGKTTLARALAGLWPAIGGELRLDGATLDQWAPDDLGKHIGYLPQDVALFSGTVAENIARLSPNPDAEKVVEAAKRAGAHEIILGLPLGYDTPIGEGGAQLSGGQRQRVGLARALYGDPALLILDEPNAHLDSEGEQSLVKAVLGCKERGRSVVLMAHRPSAIAACETLLMLEKGGQRAFGPRDEVLRQVTTNHAQTLPQAAQRKPPEAAAPQPPAAAGNVTPLRPPPAPPAPAPRPQGVPTSLGGVGGVFGLNAIPPAPRPPQAPPPAAAPPAPVVAAAPEQPVSQAAEPRDGQ